MAGVLSPRLTFSAPITKAHGYASTPFSTSAKTLPAHYLGHDAERVYVAIQHKIKLSRGEYESSDHFAARLKNASRAMLYGGMHLSDVYAFQVNNRESYVANNVNISYDADHQTLHVSPVFTSENSITYFDFRSHNDESSRYSASNVYGVQKTVGKLRESNYRVLITNINDFDTVDNLWQTKIVTEVPMSPATARLTRSHINVLAVGVLTQRSGSYTTTMTEKSTPTIDNPIDYGGVGHYICVKVTKFVVYDELSDKILATVSLR